MAFWNKKIINFEDKYFGMDISDFSVKVFQLEKKENIDKIRSFNSENLNKGCIKNGRILSKDELSQAIKKVIKKAGPKKINTKKVICSIPESKTFLRMISLPPISEKEAQESIKWEIEANIPLSADKIYFDWQFLNQENNRQNILAVAVAKEVIDDLVEVLEMSGLSVYGIEMESIATARSLILADAKKNKSSLIVDLGSGKTSFIVTNGSIPYFTSSIPFSAINITDTIAKSFNVSREEAEKIKRVQGIERSIKNNVIFNSVQPLLENLSREIEKTIDFYQNMSQSSQSIDEIIISGGGANLKGLVSYLAIRLSREIKLGNPWTNLNLGKNLPLISKEDSLYYATAIGLAMRKINYDDKT
ncbi:MAG TPA: type IV pilus assembly protein PilM [Candidatus Moranbacteria bacterium]|nr:type IV pilus assembly protein PilM [Candidatus Moranbacteria bacterium]